MNYFVKNIRIIAALSVLLILILAVWGYFAISLNAQSVPFDPKKIAEQDAKSYAQRQAEELFRPIDIVNEIYPEDKSGCKMKTSIFFILANKYIEGLPENEALGGNRMMGPLVKHVYSKVKEMGYTEALLQNMKDYQECVKKAKPNKNRSIEYDLMVKHEPCVKLSSALIDTIEAVKYRKSVKYIYDKYASDNEELDFYHTSYRDLPDPVFMFIGNVYDEYKKNGYEAAVSLASVLSMACPN